MRRPPRQRVRLLPPGGRSSRRPRQSNFQVSMKKGERGRVGLPTKGCIIGALRTRALRALQAPRALRAQRALRAPARALRAVRAHPRTQAHLSPPKGATSFRAHFSAAGRAGRLPAEAPERGAGRPAAVLASVRRAPNVRSRWPAPRPLQGRRIQI